MLNIMNKIQRKQLIIALKSHHLEDSESQYEKKFLKVLTVNNHINRQ